jgi:hypothetical protein
LVVAGVAQEARVGTSSVPVALVVSFAQAPMPLPFSLTLCLSALVVRVFLVVRMLATEGLHLLHQ